ncbi:MAG: hypothetical protein GC193_15335 [Cryomorphaceae bacterium]|nr:hypothetical protein [Cryomorphaceae bacterium]
MKKPWILALLTLLPAMGLAQYNLMPQVKKATLVDKLKGLEDAFDLAELELKGPVRKVEIRPEYVSYQSAEEKIVELDALQRVTMVSTTSFQYDKVSEHKRRDLRYDGDKLKQVAEEHSFEESHYKKKYVFEYEDGWLSKITGHGLDDGLKYVYKQEKDVLHVTKIPDSEFDAFGYSEGQKFDIYYNGDEVVQIVSYYPFGVETTSIAPKQVNVKFDYRLNNNSIEVDSLGRIVKSTTSIFGIDHIGDFHNTTITEYRYGQHGFVDHATHQLPKNRLQDFSNSNFVGSSQPTILTFDYEYQFDDHGNWITRKTITDDKTIELVVRKISYYL